MRHDKLRRQKAKGCLPSCTELSLTHSSFDALLTECQLAFARVVCSAELGKVPALGSYLSEEKFFIFHHALLSQLLLQSDDSISLKSFS